MHISAVALGSHGEVYPDGGAALLQNQFVEVHLFTIRDVQQDAGIAYRLFLTHAVDIHRTTRQMIRVLRPAAELIRVWRPETTIDDNRLHILRGLVVLTRPQTVQRIIAVA